MSQNASLEKSISDIIFVEKLKEVFSCLLASTNYDLVEIDKAMFLGFDRTCDRIVYLLADTKCDFGEIDKVMFEVVEWN
jgi:hypothetical protein